MIDYRRIYKHLVVYGAAYQDLGVAWQLLEIRLRELFQSLGLAATKGKAMLLFEITKESCQSALMSRVKTKTISVMLKHQYACI